jgi:hypothetical protein
MDVTKYYKLHDIIIIIGNKCKKKNQKLNIKPFLSSEIEDFITPHVTIYTEMDVTKCNS